MLVAGRLEGREFGRLDCSSEFRVRSLLPSVILVSWLPRLPICLYFHTQREMLGRDVRSRFNLPN